MEIAKSQQNVNAPDRSIIDEDLVRIMFNFRYQGIKRLIFANRRIITKNIILTNSRNYYTAKRVKFVELIDWDENIKFLSINRNGRNIELVS